MELEIVEQREQVAWGRVGPLVLVVWKARIAVPDIAAFHAYQRSVSLQHPEGTAVIAFVSATARPPDDEARAFMTDLLRTPNAPGFVGTTTVLYGSAFLSSIIRSVLASLSLITGQRRVGNVASSVDAALSQLVPAVTFDVEQARDAVRVFLARTGVKGA